MMRDSAARPAPTPPSGEPVSDLVLVASEALPDLVASRFGWRPMNFATVIVELTAVHFHYAGMASSLLAAEALDYLDRAGTGRRVARASVVAIVLAPPLTASGFAFSPLLQITGGILLSVGLVLLSGVILVQVLPYLPVGPWRLLLGVSAITVIAPMFLAVDWALGQYNAIPALTIPQMAQVHGTLNALGFSISGLLAWRLLAAHRQPATEP